VSMRRVRSDEIVRETFTFTTTPSPGSSDIVPRGGDEKEISRPT
jgi:hypothetical protein